MGGEIRQQAQLRRAQRRSARSVRAHRRQRGAQVLDLGTEDSDVGPSAQECVDLAEHGFGAVDVGTGDVRPGQLEAGLDREEGQRVREPRAQPLCLGNQIPGLLAVSAVKLDAGRDRR